MTYLFTLYAAVKILRISLAGQRNQVKLKIFEF